MAKQLLILDVDETLVFANEKPLADREPDFQVGPYVVYRRPFLSEFLTTVTGWFDLAVWSSASGSYVHGIVAAIFANASLHFVWSLTAARAASTRSFRTTSTRRT